MEGFLASVIRGMGIGSTYALLAVGFVIIYRATKVVNFAQPALMILGAFATSVFATSIGLPFPVDGGLQSLTAQFNGGILGGTWLSSLSADLGNGKFDGAHLVQNFEYLNPANTFVDKYYKVFANADNEPTNFIDDYPIVNARLTWESVDDTWQVALEATNLTDEYYYATIFDLLGPAGYIHGQPGRPREYAVTLKRSF